MSHACEARQRTAHRTAAAFAAATLLLTGACDGSGTDSGTVEAGGEPSQEPEANPSPTEEPTPEVPMADGPEVDRPAYSFNLPEGWTVDEGGITFTENDVVASGPLSLEGSRSLRFGADLSEIDASRDLEDSAGYFLTSTRDQASDRVRRVDDIEIDGETAVHVAGPGGRGRERFHGFLVIHDGLLLDMIVRTPGSPAESRALVESILATWEWK